MRRLGALAVGLTLALLMLVGEARAETAAGRLRTVEELSQRVASIDAAIGVVESGLSGADPAERASLLQTLEQMKADRENRKRALHRLVTGMEPRYVDMRGDDTDVEWEDEARALLSPLFVEFREATELPRRVGRLRRRVAFLKSSIPQIEHAMVSAADAMHSAPSPEARKILGQVRQEWLTKRNEIAERLTISEVELRLLEAEHASVRTAGAKLWNLVSQPRTQRLALALFAFMVTFLSSHLLHRLLARLPLLRRMIGEGMGMRIFALIVHFLGSIGAVGLLLVILYSSGDWVLLTLAIVVLVSLAIGARSAAPRFLREVQLLLNAGPVRQGERIVWNGVPWRVDTLSLATTLVNPAFSNGEILRLPLRALDTLISRPSGEHEPWFPTSLEDYVEWDGLAARVASQGPDFVELERDLSRITVPTPEFIAASPKNLSKGFRHRVVLKLDRRHEKEAAEVIPKRLEQLVREAIAAHPSGRHLDVVTASFEAISSWSFDIEVEADFKGAAALYWEELMELVQRTVLEACIAEGWTIARSEYV